MTEECKAAIPGMAELCVWLGFAPVFHDAYVTALNITGEGEATLALRSWVMTDRVDERGFYAQEKHFKATFRLRSISSVDLFAFMPGQAIIGLLDIEKTEQGFRMTFETSYGFAGTIDCGAISVEFVPTEKP
jgi:hypothetical protein